MSHINNVLSYLRNCVDYLKNTAQTADFVPFINSPQKVSSSCRFFPADKRHGTILN